MYGVVIGAICGHCICTFLAVVAGGCIAYKISVKRLTILGGLLFIAFCIVTIVELFKEA